MNKKIAKETTEAIITAFAGLIIVAIMVGSLFGILHLGSMHWLFYGLIPVYMWLILYFAFTLNDGVQKDGE